MDYQGPPTPEQIAEITLKQACLVEINIPMLEHFIAMAKKGLLTPTEFKQQIIAEAARIEE